MTTEFRFNNRWVILVGYATLASLLVISAIFYQERCCYTDMAFHVFRMVNTKSFAIQNFRFGAVFTQVFPLSAILLKLPLRQVILIYSMAFYVYYLVIFMTVVHYFKNEWLGMCLVFFLTIMCSYSFYWAQSEFPQANGILVLFLAALLKYSRSPSPFWVPLLLLPILIIVLIFFHPLVIFPLSFALVYFYLNKNISGRFILFPIVILTLAFAVKRIFFNGGYESDKMDLLNRFTLLFPNYFTTPSWKFFASQLFKDYIAFTLLSLTIIIYYWRTRLFGKLLFFAGYIAGYIFLINVSYYNIGKDPYMQNMFLPLGLMIALPFFFEIAPKISPLTLTVLMALIMVFRISMLYKQHTAFSARLNYLSSLLNYTKRYDGNRFLVPLAHLPAKIIGPDWGLPYETVLLSGMPSPDSVRTIETGGVVKYYNDVKDSDNVFINRFAPWGVDELNNNYFRFRKCKYRLLNEDLQNL